MPFVVTFISTNLNVNRQPVVNNCLGGCGIKFSGYNRYACPNCSMSFVIPNTDKELLMLNNSLRSKLKKKYQPTVISLFTDEVFLEILYSKAEPDFKKLVISDMIWGEEFLKDTNLTC